MESWVGMMSTWCRHVLAGWGNWTEASRSRHAVLGAGRSKALGRRAGRDMVCVIAAMAAGWSTAWGAVVDRLAGGLRAKGHARRRDAAALDWMRA